MAVEQSRPSGGGNGFLYFAVAALLVAVAALGWMFYTGETHRSSSDTAVERMAESVGAAADKIGDSARDATRNLPKPATIPTPAPVPAPTN